MKFTKASFATHVSLIVRSATFEAGQLAQGMWNPLFCSDDASGDALRFCSEMQRYIDEVKKAALGQGGDK